MILPTEPALLQRWMAPVYRMLGYDDKTPQAPKSPDTFPDHQRPQHASNGSLAAAQFEAAKEASRTAKGSIIGPDLEQDLRGDYPLGSGQT